MKLAEGLGVQVSSKWLTWLKASCIPAVISLLVTPVVLYKVFPPEMKDTPDAPLMARRRLQQMGPMKSDEWVMTIVMLVTVGLWIAGYVQKNPDIKQCSRIICWLSYYLLLLPLCFSLFALSESRVSQKQSFRGKVRYVYITPSPTPLVGLCWICCHCFGCVRYFFWLRTASPTLVERMDRFFLYGFG